MENESEKKLKNKVLNINNMDDELFNLIKKHSFQFFPSIMNFVKKNAGMLKTKETRFEEIEMPNYFAIIRPERRIVG